MFSRGINYRKQHKQCNNQPPQKAHKHRLKRGAVALLLRFSIMELCWDEPDTSLDRTVDAHVKNIRNKLRNVKPDLDPIVTHRGMGYSLKEDL
ncbi:MAG: winged helix-turn-helix domain-containing protein [Thermodesulfobacteriota bacterium]|jgi:DNA-binding response OmpR family regulator